MNQVSGELIGLAIALILMVGSGVVNWVRKQREETEARRRQQEGREQRELRTQLPRSEVAPGAGDAVRARREQLRQLALQRQQQGGVPPVAAPAPVEPTNLSMAERIARARAKEQYARRAEALRKQQAGGGRPAAPASRGGQSAAERERAIAMERARREARARAEAEMAQAQRQRQLQQQAQHAQQEARRRAAAAARKSGAGPQPGTGVQREQRLRRLVSLPGVAGAAAERAAGVSSARSAVRAPMGVSFGLDHRSIRQAIVFKEILDRPLALRGPEQSQIL